MFDQNAEHFSRSVMISDLTPARFISVFCSRTVALRVKPIILLTTFKAIMNSKSPNFLCNPAANVTGFFIPFISTLRPYIHSNSFKMFSLLRHKAPIFYLYRPFVQSIALYKHLSKQNDSTQANVF